MGWPGRHDLAGPRGAHVDDAGTRCRDLGVREPNVGLGRLCGGCRLLLLARGEGALPVRDLALRRFEARAGDRERCA